MAYAMLYAVMNLGGWLPTWLTGVRERHGIAGAYWVLTAATLVGLLATAILLSRRTVANATAAAAAERAEEKNSSKEEAVEDGGTSGQTSAAAKVESSGGHVPLHIWVLLVAVAALVCFVFPRPWSYAAGGAILLVTLALEMYPPGRRWIAQHPLADRKFFFFIFALIPVQTLFAHNWLTIPMYVNRAYRETWPWISTNFEKATNLNPLLIFILVPIVTALTRKRNVYSLMIVGSLIMALPAFLLALGPYQWTLVSYLVLMTVGEALWQPRFLQYAAEIAPEGRTGAYMGVAQFPWFLTKVIVPLYSGWFLQNYCPQEGAMHSQQMWLIYACIATSSAFMLVLARGWLGKDFKSKAN